MKKLIERLLIFLIGIPAIVCLILLLPYHKNLALNLIAIFFSAMGAVEFSSMLEKKQIRVTKIESFILGALAPLAVTLNVSFCLDDWIIYVVIMSGAGWVLLSSVFTRSKEIDAVINKITGGFSLLIYPGFFIYWLIKMSSWGKPEVILLFLLMTFGNDSLAWFAGNLFGKNNRGLIAVSPNKSIAGFIGGILGSIIIAVGALYIFPALYSDITVTAASLLPMVILLGFCTGIAAILGDLAESAIKRSCDFKDSGNMMLGRGGVLDSLDSIAAAAPVFYLIFFHVFR
ncbi:MAG: phosphatidate cytidylyltransferase [Treponema sp.]|nr:phosphatidate cytidylyltransferase [Treponema sp.]